MPCYHPIEGFRGVDGALVFSRTKGTGLPMRVPCGRCIGCRLERSRQWATRCMHEAQLHDSNSFITLTYADDHLPRGGSLVVSDFQKFMKRLRRRVGRVRFFHCGEYGADFSRPHYHALLFGFAFPDRKPWADRGTGPVFRSELLEDLWPVGHSEIGSVTFESAAYVARYCVKKVTGSGADEHYANPETGELRAPEYATMSRRPGIGRGWIDRFMTDVYPSDEVIVRGHSSKPPRFYDEAYRECNPARFEALKTARIKARCREDQTPERLSVREVCATARATLFTRRLES